jgi:hypothetical protein
MTARLRHAASNDAVGIANLDHHDVPNSIVSFKGDGSPQDMACRIAAISIVSPADEGRGWHSRRRDWMCANIMSARRTGTGWQRGALWIAPAIAEARARHRPYFNSNPQSIALHETCGFKKAGHIAKAGFTFAYLDRCRVLAAHSLAVYR